MYVVKNLVNYANSIFQDCKLLKPTVGINSVRQMEIFRILSGILHLGNVELAEGKADSSYVPVRNS